MQETALSLLRWLSVCGMLQIEAERSRVSLLEEKAGRYDAASYGSSDQ